MNNNLVTTFEDITVGMTIRNSSCGTFTVIAINADKDRTLLFNQNPNAHERYIGAWALQHKGDNWYWSQGHYFGGDLQSATEYVLDIQPPEPKQDDIAIIVEEGRVTDVFSTGNHMVEIVDLDSVVDEYENYVYLENRANEIRNDERYKNLY